MPSASCAPPRDSREVITSSKISMRAVIGAPRPKGGKELGITREAA